jgi:hypothetical protein
VQTEIQYVAGHEKTAQNLGAALAIPARLVEVKQIERQMQVRIVLGKDFSAVKVAATKSIDIPEFAAQLPQKALPQATPVSQVRYRSSIPAWPGHIDFFKSFF